jgi:hypothetical protein
MCASNASLPIAALPLRAVEQDGSLCLVPRAELERGIVAVNLDGARGDPQRLANAVRGQALSDQAHDVRFAGGERGHCSIAVV